MITSTTKGTKPHGEHKIVGGENNSFGTNEIYVKIAALLLLAQAIVKSKEKYLFFFFLTRLAREGF